MAALLSPSSKINLSQKSISNSKVLHNCLSSKGKVKIDKSRYSSNLEQINDILANPHMTLNYSKSPRLIKLQLNHCGIKPHFEERMLTGRSNGIHLSLALSSSSKSNVASMHKCKDSKSKSTIGISHSPSKQLDSSRNHNNTNNRFINTHHKTNSMVLNSNALANVHGNANGNTSNILMHNPRLKRRNNSKVNIESKPVIKSKPKSKPRPKSKTNTRQIKAKTITSFNKSKSKSKSPFNKSKQLNQSTTIKVNKTNSNNYRNCKGTKRLVTTRNNKSIGDISSNVSHSLITRTTNSTFLRIKQGSIVNTRLNKPQINNLIHISCSENNFNSTLSCRHSNSVNKIKLNAKNKLTRHIPSLNPFSTSTNLSSNEIMPNSNELKINHNNAINPISIPIIQKAKMSSRNSQGSYNLSNMETLNKSITNNNITNKTIHSISKISQTGFAGLNKSKVNQDNLFVYSSIASNDNSNEYNFVGVCDGHGNKGDLISKFIIETLPSVLNKELKEKDISISSSSALIHKAIDNSFILTNSKLSNDSTIDTHFSGSTCVSVLFSNERLFCANVGDSRALLGKYNRTAAKWECIPLSRDHKPIEVDEAKRISRYGGRIDQYQQSDGTRVGPLRIWIKNKSIPGLAMTRSIGDQIASNVGVTCEPEIREVILKEEDKFVILASDGLWEYISNEDCIKIVSHYYKNSKDSENAIKELYKRAFKKWIENDTTIDDITIVLIFFA